MGSFTDERVLPPLRVFLTVDTECWPRGLMDWRATGIEDVARDIFGVTASGEYGLRYQLKRFDEYKLRASYFVEALSIGIIGAAVMTDVADTIRAHHHAVELHAHGEWLRHIPDSPCPEFTGQHLDELRVDDQVRVIECALEYFAKCGISRVQAFRAGNFTVSRDTLAALAAVGIPFDSSLNIRYTRQSFDALELTHPTAIRGTHEIPVTWFVDGFGRYRAAHLTGCSAPELSEALLHAWRDGWGTFVIVLHSFDLLTQARTVPDKAMVRRFDMLCRFLAANPDKFRTVTFADVAPGDIVLASTLRRPLRSSIRHTALRAGRQALRRYLNSRR